MKSALIVAGLIGAMVLAVAVARGWLTWRKRTIRAAGARIGLTALEEGGSLMVPLVPLIDQRRRTYLLILAGDMRGHPGAFFDLFVGSGENWNLQSTVLLRNPGIPMPRFQLQTAQWSMMRQRTRGESVVVPGREEDMRRLRLTSDDPTWARDVFSRAHGGFLEKVRNGRWTVEGFGSALVIYRWGTRVRAGRLATYVDEAAELGVEIFKLCGPRFPEM